MSSTQLTVEIHPTSKPNKTVNIAMCGHRAGRLLATAYCWISEQVLRCRVRVLGPVSTRTGTVRLVVVQVPVYVSPLLCLCTLVRNTRPDSGWYILHPSSCTSHVCIHMLHPLYSMFVQLWCCWEPCVIVHWFGNQLTVRTL